MRIATVWLTLMFQLGLALPTHAQTATVDGSTSSRKLTIVPIDRTHVRLALPERSAQAQARPRAAAAGATSARSAPVMPPAVRGQ